MEGAGGAAEPAPGRPARLGDRPGPAGQGAARPSSRHRAPRRSLAAERDEYLDALRRLQADFDNFRKRSLRQQTELLETRHRGSLHPSCCPCSTPSTSPPSTCASQDEPERRRQGPRADRLASSRRPRPRGPRADRRRRRPLRPDDPRRRRPRAGRAATGTETPTPGPCLGPRGAAIAKADRPSTPAKREQAARPAPSPPGRSSPRSCAPGYKMRSKVLRPAMVLVRD